MNWIAEDAISLLMFLAPGLVVVGIFRSLTSYPPPSVFDQIVQALIFTIIVQQFFCAGIVELYGIIFDEGGASLTIQYPLYLSFPVAVVFAILLAATYGNDTIHRHLRRLHVTRETSFPSEWYSAFHKLQNNYVILHLVGERRVYGWPEEWPGQPEKGHFRLSEYTWLPRGEDDEAAKLSYPGQESSYQESILIPVSEVDIVEFMGLLPEDKSLS